MIDTHFHLIHPSSSKSGLNGHKPHLELETEMNRCGILGGIAVQPSIYRYDNTHLLSVLKQYSETMRGVCVVPETIHIQQLEALKKQGIIGVRLNMVDNPDQHEAPHPDFFRKLTDTGLFLQVHSQREQLANIIELAIASGVSVIVDHIGKPNPELGTNQLGFKEMIEGAIEGNVTIKLSAPFRISDENPQFEIASRFARAALDRAPLDRFILGTDWPFINCDNKPSMDSIFHWFKTLLPEETDFQKVAVENARKLTGLLTEKNLTRDVAAPKD